MVGNKESLKFDVMGKPFPKITVMKAETELKEEKHVKFSVSEEVFQITFENVVEEDEAIYTIEVSNEAGKDSTSIAITTQGSSLIFQFYSFSVYEL